MSILYLDFIHEQTLVLYIILSDSSTTFSSLSALKFLSRFIGSDCPNHRSWEKIDEATGFFFGEIFGGARYGGI